MPELPEVETVVRQLQKLVGRTIKNVEIFDNKVMDQQLHKVVNSKITSVKRRAKSIIFELNNDNYLLAHLRMTGHFHHTVKSDESYKKYLAGVFHLDDKTLFTYNTIRRFGSVNVLSKKELDEYIGKYGPEPLEISPQDFVKLCEKSPHSVIKNKLLDQSFMVGIGNIYAQEGLYHAGILPTKKIGEVPRKKLLLLHQEMQRILKIAIKNNGTTVDNYTHLDGKGSFQDMLAVYNQENCPQKHQLQKINIGGRGTFYCNICQR